MEKKKKIMFLDRVSSWQLVRGSCLPQRHELNSTQLIVFNLYNRTFDENVDSPNPSYNRYNEVHVCNSLIFIHYYH